MPFPGVARHFPGSLEDHKTTQKCARAPRCAPQPPETTHDRFPYPPSTLMGLQGVKTAILTSKNTKNGHFGGSAGSLAGPLEDQTITQKHAKAPRCAPQPPRTTHDQFPYPPSTLGGLWGVKTAILTSKSTQNGHFEGSARCLAGPLEDQKISQKRAKAPKCAPQPPETTQEAYDVVPRASGLPNRSGDPKDLPKWPKSLCRLPGTFARPNSQPKLKNPSRAINTFPTAL